MSTHETKVIRIEEVLPHPNADSLGLVKVWGYTCIVRLGDFKPGDLAVYVEPDYVLPDRPEYAFLQGHLRIKARRLRGIWSQGLLIHAPAGTVEGDDVMALLGITRYEPPEPLSTGGEAERGPSGFFPVYDLEPLRKYAHLLRAGEQVVCTEKLHGASGRYCFRDGRMYVSSHRQWKREDSGNLWWKALAQNAWVQPFCEAHPEMTLYGEVFGQVQDLKYGAGRNDLYFRVFDVLAGNAWLTHEQMIALLDETQRVPVIYSGPMPELPALEELSRGGSTLADHLAEGLVIRPVIERSDPEIGRVVLKLVSDKYLERQR